ncbi:hypothetical protein Tco_1026528 [Tanacetum coccineum]
MAASTEALIAAVAVVLPSSSPPPSPLSTWSSPLPQIPSPSLPLPSPPLPLPAPSSPLLLPASDYREDVPEADVLRRKRLCLTAPTPSFVDNVDATPRHPMSKEVGYRITDVWDDMVGDMKEGEPTTLEELSQRVIDLAATLTRDTHEMRYHLHTTMLLESKARYAQHAWSQAMDYNRAVHAELLAYRAEVRALHEHMSVLQRQRTEDSDRLTRHIQQGHDMTKESEPARDPKPQDGPVDAGSSCNGYSQKDKNKGKMNKTEHGIGKSMRK